MVTLEYGEALITCPPRPSAPGVRTWPSLPVGGRENAQHLLMTSANLWADGVCDRCDLHIAPRKGADGITEHTAPEVSLPPLPKLSLGARPASVKQKSQDLAGRAGPWVFLRGLAPAHSHGGNWGTLWPPTQLCMALDLPCSVSSACSQQQRTSVMPLPPSYPPPAPPSPISGNCNSILLASNPNPRSLLHASLPSLLTSTLQANPVGSTLKSYRESNHI